MKTSLIFPILVELVPPSTTLTEHAGPLLGHFFHCIKIILCIIYICQHSHSFLHSHSQLEHYHNIRDHVLFVFVFLVPDNRDFKRMLVEWIDYITFWNLLNQKLNLPERLLYTNLGFNSSFTIQPMSLVKPLNIHASYFLHLQKCGHNLLCLLLRDDRINELIHMNYYELFWRRAT